MFLIEADRQRVLLRLKLSGVWDMDTLERFEKERAETITREGWNSGNYVVLVDMTDHGVQCQDVHARGAMYNRDACRHAPRKTALVVSSMLKKMQVARILHRGDEQVFTSEAEAMAWLQSDDGATGTPRALSA